MSENNETLDHFKKELKDDGIKEMQRIHYNSKKEINNKEEALEAIKQYVDVFEYISEELRADKEIFAVAVKQNAEALEFASKKLRKDKDVRFILKEREKESSPEIEL